jgi:hypothetical protein
VGEHCGIADTMLLCHWLEIIHTADTIGCYLWDSQGSMGSQRQPLRQISSRIFSTNSLFEAEYSRLDYSHNELVGSVDTLE